MQRNDFVAKQPYSSITIRHLRIEEEAESS